MTAVVHGYGDMRRRHWSERLDLYHLILCSSSGAEEGLDNRIGARALFVDDLKPSPRAKNEAQDLAQSTRAFASLNTWGDDPCTCQYHSGTN